MKKHILKRYIKKIDEMRSLLGKRWEYPYDTFLEKMSLSFQLLQLVEKSNVKKEIKIEARKNFIINCITAVEVFFKDMIIGLDWFEVLNEDGIDELLSEKITLTEAWLLLKTKNISLGEIIAAKFSFQSLPEINKIMKKLLGVSNFLKEVEQYEVTEIDEDNEEEKVKFVLKDAYPDWRKKVQEIFELRHKFVHQVSFKDRIGLHRLKELYRDLDAFVEASEQYLLSFVPLEENNE